MYNKIWLAAFVVVLLFLFATTVTAARPRHNLLDQQEKGATFGPNLNGVLNPESYYQRYRREEYPKDRPFFQWWYYWVKDTKTNRHFAFSYSVSFFADNYHGGSGNNGSIPVEEGVYIGFAVVDKSVTPTTRLMKYEFYPASALTVDNYFDFQVNLGDGENGVFRIQVLDDNHLHLTGHLNHTDKVWQYNGCDESLEIHWDLVLTRIYGWFGQNLFETPDILLGHGLIQWNTYAHDSLVDGTIQIGDQTYDFSSKEGSRYRMYGDMNWGEHMPQPPAHLSPSSPEYLDYAWGWYYAGVPAAASPFSDDISIIAGTGLTEADFPFYSMLGRFADIRLGNATHVELVQVQGWDLTRAQTNFIYSSNDVKLINFDVSRSQWTTFTDKFGSAQIPLVQAVTLETTHYSVVMTFTSEITDYNRLLFPTQGRVFSDFEALGVTVNTVVKANDQVLLDVTLDTGGLEFGYYVSMD